MFDMVSPDDPVLIVMNQACEDIRKQYPDDSMEQITTLVKTAALAIQRNPSMLLDAKSILEVYAQLRTR